MKGKANGWHKGEWHLPVVEKIQMAAGKACRNDVLYIFFIMQLTLNLAPPQVVS